MNADGTVDQTWKALYQNLLSQHDAWASQANEAREGLADAHEENAAIRRAYLHERQRATTACNELRTYDPATADKIESQAYRDVRGLDLDYPRRTIAELRRFTESVLHISFLDGELEAILDFCDPCTANPKAVR